MQNVFFLGGGGGGGEDKVHYGLYEYEKESTWTP